ncbi:MAG: hypothetical protein ABR992_18955 [Solirubrobacteraceae bacterium]
MTTIAEAATTSLTEPVAARLATDDGEDPPSLVFLGRGEAIARLQALVRRRQREEGLSFRQAMKVVAVEVGLTNIAVRRLLDRYPDN